MKNNKFETFAIFSLLILILVIILSIFGTLLRYNFLGVQKYKSLQNIAVMISELPKNVSFMLRNKTLNLNLPPKYTKHKDKKRLNKYKYKKRNALLVLPRYDYSIKRSVVDIIDLNNFETIHTYKSDVKELHAKIKNNKEFPNIAINHLPIRFHYQHPLIFSDGSLISNNHYSPQFKIDFCSNLIWINDEESFHHSQELDSENNIWVTARMEPKSKYVDRYNFTDILDDSIIKMNTEGKILFNKSVVEILIENNILPENFVFNSRKFYDEKHIIHLNDIEPAFHDTKYWKKNDLFISIRNLSSIIHYRPSTNKIINYLTGDFAAQHDVDIISDNEISIFNNNLFNKDERFFEILKYNFETKKYSKVFNKQLKEGNFFTQTQGLSHFFNDGALMVEETDHGRIALYNKIGEKEWEYVNKDKNGNIGPINWSRVIEDEKIIEDFKKIVTQNKC